VTLSVIDGTWNAFAANDISLKEVNNPNGAFNTLQSFLFNYASDAAANFWAGNAIELIGANLGRLTSVNKTPIYAPILSLNAGVGGIKIDKSIILAPSSKGSLTIITRDGGDFERRGRFRFDGVERHHDVGQRFERLHHFLVRARQHSPE